MIGLTFSIQGYPLDVGLPPSSDYKGSPFFWKNKQNHNEISKFGVIRPLKASCDRLSVMKLWFLAGTPKGPEYTYIYRGFSGPFALFGPLCPVRAPLPCSGSFALFRAFLPCSGYCWTPWGDHPERAPPHGRTGHHHRHRDRHHWQHWQPPRSPDHPRDDPKVI